MRSPLSRLRSYIWTYVCVEGVAVAILFMVIAFWVSLLLDYGTFKGSVDVVIGEVSDRGMAIVSGLSGNERIVESAGAFLAPGQKVRPERARSAR